MNKADPRYAPSVVNGRSAFMDKLTTASTTVPTPATKPLAGGADGTVLSANDGPFVSAIDPLFATGGIVDRIDIFNLVCVPGLTNVNSTTQGALARRCSTIATTAGRSCSSTAWTMKRSPRFRHRSPASPARTR